MLVGIAGHCWTAIWTEKNIQHWYLSINPDSSGGFFFSALESVLAAHCRSLEIARSREPALHQILRDEEGKEYIQSL